MKAFQVGDIVYYISDWEISKQAKTRTIGLWRIVGLSYEPTEGNKRDKPTMIFISPYRDDGKLLNPAEVQADQIRKATPKMVDSFLLQRQKS